jgi:ketosteroid isomerase-like protein
MNTFQGVADRVEIEALRGEFTDAAMMGDRARLASLFTPDGALRMPNIPVELIGREEIRTGGERLQAQLELFVQTTHPGVIEFDGDTATGRAYIQELARGLDGRQGVNFAIYHDRYRRTGEGWKFAERIYEVRYLDTTPLTGAEPRIGGADGSTPVAWRNPRLDDHGNDYQQEAHVNTTGTTTDLTLFTGTWKLDPQETSIAFRTRAIWVFPIKGTAKALSGGAAIDTDGRASGTLVIDAASFNT